MTGVTRARNLLFLYRHLHRQKWRTTRCKPPPMYSRNLLERVPSNIATLSSTSLTVARVWFAFFSHLFLFSRSNIGLMTCYRTSKLLPKRLQKRLLFSTIRFKPSMPHFTKTLSLSLPPSSTNSKRSKPTWSPKRTQFNTRIER